MIKKILWYYCKMFNYLDDFLEVLVVEKSASSHTVDAYRRDIMGYLQYLKQKNIELSTNNKDDFEDYIKQNFSDAQARTVSRKISANRQFYQFLVLEGILESNPLLRTKFPKRNSLVPKSLSSSQLEQIFKTLAQDNSNAGIRLFCIVELLYSTGLRISELIALKLDDLTRNRDVESGICEHLLIRGKGGRDRIIILNPSACKILEHYLKVRHQFVPEAKMQDAIWLFPSVGKSGKMTHISRQRVGQMLKDLAIRANLDPALLSPHKIRHTFASHMIQNGANVRFVQELLGHADISSTQIYTKILNTQAKNLVLEKHPMAVDD